MTATQELVTVATYDVPLSAAVVKNALTADGIPAVLADLDLASTLPSEAVGGAKILVPADFAAQAALMIAALDQAGGTETYNVEELARQALMYQPETV